MRSTTVRCAGIALLVLGLLTTAWSIYIGFVKFYLVVIVPVLTSDNALGLLPLLAVFAGVVLTTVGPAFGKDHADMPNGGKSANVDETPDKGRTKIGGVVLIGPIPILFGSDRSMTLIAAAISIMILAIVVLLLL